MTAAAPLRATHASRLRAGERREGGEAAAHQKTEPSLPSPVALGFSDAVMIIRTIGRVASSIFLEKMIQQVNFLRALLQKIIF